jgi:hypothetical protein
MNLVRSILTKHQPEQGRWIKQVIWVTHS